MPDFMDSLYFTENDGDRQPLKALGDFLKMPERFEHGKDTLVARIPQLESDGYRVEVYEVRMPARFYSLRALPTKNSLGNLREGFEISTGSGDDMGELIATLALQVSKGMVGVRPLPKKGKS